MDRPIYDIMKRDIYWIPCLSWDILWGDHHFGQSFGDIFIAEEVDQILCVFWDVVGDFVGYVEPNFLISFEAVMR